MFVHAFGPYYNIHITIIVYRYGASVDFKHGTVVYTLVESTLTILKTNNNEHFIVYKVKVENQWFGRSSY